MFQWLQRRAHWQHAAMECICCLLYGMMSGWVAWLLWTSNILKTVISCRTGFYRAITWSHFLASVKLNKTPSTKHISCLRVSNVLCYQLKWNSVHFITASYENVSSIHIPHLRCLTWAYCIKSQSCVHKFNIFFPFMTIQCPTLQTAVFVYWFKTILFSACPIYFAYLSWSRDILVEQQYYHHSRPILFSTKANTFTMDVLVKESPISKTDHL